MGLHCWTGFFLSVESGGYCLLRVWSPPIAVASPGAEHRLYSAWTSVAAAHGLQSPGTVVVVYGPCCSTTCGIFLDQGLNPCLLHWQADSLPLSLQGSPLTLLLMRWSWANYLVSLTFSFLIYGTVIVILTNRVEVSKVSPDAWFTTDTHLGMGCSVS